MKILTLAIGLVVCSVLAAEADDKPLVLNGKYALVSGKKNGAAVDEKAKKAAYTVTADTFTIDSGKSKFVFSYKLKADTDPLQIDLSVTEGPEGSPKGAPAFGIVELKGDTLKIAYSLDKEKRPKDFEGKAGYMYELKKEKAK